MFATEHCCDNMIVRNQNGSILRIHRGEYEGGVTVYSRDRNMSVEWSSDGSQVSQGIHCFMYSCKLYQCSFEVPS